MSHRLRMLCAVAAGTLFAVLFVFHPGFDNDFYRDDFRLLERSVDAARDPGVLWERWVEPFNRPLAQAAFALEYRVWGLDSGRYILTNTLLHALNAVLLYGLLQAPLGAPAAATAALLFALGLGFYGKAVLWAANLPDLLATSFVLATGITAHRAQIARLAPQRAAWMGLAGILFALALACKESGIMAVVMVGGLMWPHRRSVASVVRKIGVLMAVCAGYLLLQLVAGSGVARIAGDPGAWLAMPMRALRLATLMIAPVQESSLLASAQPLLVRTIVLVDQVRPVLGIALLAAAALWFVRGSGAVRWLLASYAAFLLPFGLIPMPGDWLDIRYAYLPATCFCALAAYVLRSWWIGAGRGGRVLLGIVVCATIAADVTLARRLEVKYAGFGRSPESQESLRALQEKLTGSPHI